MKELRDLISTRKAGVTDFDIKSAEEKLGAVFPEQYKELFRLVNNAEIGEWTLFPIKDQKNPKKTWDDVVRQNQDAKDEEMSSDLIAIGDDGTGDKLCLQVINGKMNDEIYIWNHETAEIEEYTSNLKDFIKLDSENGEFDEDE
ncbi:hypothetical protein ABH966_002358 [Lysinibacillus sp. RC46]|uniref:SMI1/KNR4 family protein n=1 Tax=unclassified Lysinibacillus TaxID=2636778 RepID=UPI00351886F4